MACEPHVTLFKSASDSLARRKILADFPQSIAKQQIRPKLPSKVTTCIVSDFVVLCNTNVQLYGSHGKPFLNMTLPWLSLSQKGSLPQAYNDVRNFTACINCGKLANKIFVED